MITQQQVLDVLAGHPGSDARKLARLAGLNSSDREQVRRVRSALARLHKAGKVTRELRDDPDGGFGTWEWTVAPA